MIDIFTGESRKPCCRAQRNYFLSLSDRARAKHGAARVAALVRLTWLSAVHLRQQVRTFHLRSHASRGQRACGTHI